MTSSEGFLSLSQVALIDFLSRDSFFSPVIEIFKAIVQWMEKNNVGVDEARFVVGDEIAADLEQRLVQHRQTFRFTSTRSDSRCSTSVREEAIGVTTTWIIKYEKI